MREFAVYTALRLALMAGCFVVVAGVWALFAGGDAVPVLPALLLAIVASGVASYFLLRRQREAFARRVQSRADRVSARFEEMRAREDDTEDSVKDSVSDDPRQA